MSLKLCVLIAIYFGQSYGVCPLGFEPYADSCYHFSKDSENFLGALAVCRELGAQLVEIETQAENNYVTTQCRQIRESFWIGLTDLRAEGTYIWMTSKKVLAPGDFTEWEPGQPDNHGGDENCVDLRESFGWSWNDSPCHINQNYVCEMKNGEAELIG